MPTFAHRFVGDEMMDDFSIVDDRLTRALDNLRTVNRFLGGYAVVKAALAPLVEARQPIRVLDLATGVADYPEALVRWAEVRGVPVEVVAQDANPVTAAYARAVLDRRLAPPLRAHIRVEVGDALDLPYADGAFDVVVASHFLHHLDGDAAVALLREMNRVARRGLVINDLHRHPLAYYSIVALAAVLPVSPMFRHDGPISVLRGFNRDELRALAEAAGLRGYRIGWHWAFRWSLSTISPDLS